MSKFLNDVTENWRVVFPAGSPRTGVFVKLNTNESPIRRDRQ